MNQRELFRVSGLPVFQNKMFADRESALACATGDMVLVQDIDTGLIFNAGFDPSLLVYDADYQNEQACSSVFQQHLNDVQAIIERNFSNSTLIEVGCGKGYFLEHLLRAGYRITGIDPAYEGNNSAVIKAPFEPSLGLSANGIILRHVLEHMTDPVEFLSTIAAANDGKGKVYIEVPCFDWICEHRAWFDIFYEHVNYFRLSDFYRMFGTVHEGGHVFGGQYLYVVAELSSLRRPRCSPQDLSEFPADFLRGVERAAQRARGISGAVWGAASKGVIFALYMERNGVTIEHLIDINPAKQNKFIAATGLKVCSPVEGMAALHPGDDIFVMNSNYLAEIVALSKNQFNYIKVDRDEF